MTGNWLILETSGRAGQVGLARSGEIVRSTVLDDRRRHVRDLALSVSSLLEAESLRPIDLAGVAVGRGPGSYTGLRVGIMSAKALAYATGCELRAVDTFAAIALQAPAEARELWVLADALNAQVYLQRFARGEAGVLAPVEELRIASIDECLPLAAAGTWMSGPGVTVYADRIPETCPLVPEGEREPRTESVFEASRAVPALSRAELFALEPLYLRASSAEEKRK
jgi:tRNA threonylcarbamoyladenosine biosynthesis protein TsaB